MTKTTKKNIKTITFLRDLWFISINKMPFDVIQNLPFSEIQNQQMEPLANTCTTKRIRDRASKEYATKMIGWPKTTRKKLSRLPNTTGRNVTKLFTVATTLATKFSSISHHKRMEVDQRK